MSTAITTAPAKTTKASALALLASRLNVEPEKMLTTLKATVCNKATNEEIMAFCIVANEYGLNPFLKELYAFPAKGGGIVPVVSVDGWIRIVNEHPQMNGLEFSFTHDDKGKISSCTCTLHRKDRAHPVVVTEFLSECYRNTEPWKMESRMLRHKALIQCARVAFGFSGIHDEDEAEVISQRNVTPKKGGGFAEEFKEPEVEAPTVEAEVIHEPADQDGYTEDPNAWKE